MKLFRFYQLGTILFLATTLSLFAAEDSAWVKIFNGKDLAGWTPYFQKLGLKNPDSTFKVTPEGNLLVNIHLPLAQTGFGHLFYTQKKLSYYMVRAIYSFPTTTFGYADWDQGWNFQNNGLMLHSQDPASMNSKDFPNSIEVQLLGMQNTQNPAEKSKGFKYATTANMCSPGTLVAYNGTADYTPHCTAAQYPDAWKNTEIPWEDKQGWSDVTVRVLADSLVQHYIHGIKVFEYTKIRLDNKTPLKEGYLAIQAEGTETQFKSIEILDLTGCMDKAKTAYRSYFVRNDPAACNTISIDKKRPSQNFSLIREGRGIRVKGNDALITGIRRINGAIVEGFKLGDKGVRAFTPSQSGVYLVTIGDGRESLTLRMPFF